MGTVLFTVKELKFLGLSKVTLKYSYKCAACGVGGKTLKFSKVFH